MSTSISPHSPTRSSPTRFTSSLSTRTRHRPRLDVPSPTSRAPWRSTRSPTVERLLLSTGFAWNWRKAWWSTRWKGTGNRRPFTWIHRWWRSVMFSNSRCSVGLVTLEPKSRKVWFERIRKQVKKENERFLEKLQEIDFLFWSISWKKIKYVVLEGIYCFCGFS